MLALSSAFLAAKWPLRAPHRDQVPAGFDCEMRKAAYAFGKKTLPRLGDFMPLFYALDLNEDCATSTPSGMNGATGANVRVPADAIFVEPALKPRAATGALGTIGFPFRSLQAAADAAAAQHNTSKTVVLRGGTYYLSSPLNLDARHSGLTFVNMPNESPVVSGGTELKVKWQPYDAPTPGQDIWETELSENAVYGGSPDNKTYTIFGQTDDYKSCEAACKTDSRCQIWTWHDDHQGSYSHQCWFRLDGKWGPRQESGHVSGYNASFLHLQKNVWVADISGQVDEVPGLQIDGVRATRARACLCLGSCGRSPIVCCRNPIPCSRGCATRVPVCHLCATRVPPVCHPWITHRHNPAWAQAIQTCRGGLRSLRAMMR